MSSSAEHATLPSGHTSSHWTSALLPSATDTARLADILRSTVLPTTEDTYLFRRVSSEAPADLARYNAGIENIPLLLERVKSERELLSTYTERCRSALSPIRCLPTELLIDMLDMCAPSWAESIGNEDTEAMEVERIAKTHLLQLSSVCYRWYETIMVSPKLWSTIAADANLWDQTDIRREHLLRRLELSLERGANSPLVMELGLPHDDDELQSSILELVLPHATRWRDVHLWINPSSVELLAKMRGNFPRLESLSLSASTSEPYPPGPAVFDLAPRLRNLALTGWPWRPEIPWGQLLDVRFQNDAASVTSGLDILSLLQRGAEYWMDFNRSTVSLGSLVWKPIVSHLSIFTILFSGVVDSSITQAILRNMLESVTMPSLRELYIYRDPTGPPSFWPQSAFLSFTTRSCLSLHLTDLEIQTVIQDRELIQYHNRHAVVTDFLLDRLACTDGHSNLVPRLQYCHFRTILRFGDGYLNRFIRFRVASGQVKTLEIEFALPPTREGTFSPELLAQMEQLKTGKEFLFSIEDIAPGN
ncbi:hypothetical protein FB45DRAFT_1069106 [Roridomyces roridus]|uniref:F-box domain-containing protein n=1 Tax=Roridomyces roridus TaxID=1738132 RepID=A0AAD7F6U1_9AGAR|nr:hypothetical protein FB45DRAFT_1069106 [Roridomyces roridus]